MLDKKMKTIKEQQKNRTKGIIISLFISIILTLLLITPPEINALPEIQIISQIDTLEYGEVQRVQISILTNNTNATIIQALIEFDQQNHTLQKESQHYAYAWVPQQKGNNTYTIYATDSQNEIQTSTSTFTVTDTTPPEITETGPTGTLNYNLIELKAITNENSTCKYDAVDVSYDSMLFTLSGNSLMHTKLRSFGDGETQLYVKCKDTSDNIGQSKTIQFIIDTTPPTIYGITPTGTVNQQQLSLRISTDELATCKWGKNNQVYDNLENYFQTTGALLHEQPMQINEGLNTIYLSCKDPTGNKDETQVLNIELNLPPAASISLEKNTSYKAISHGTYKLTLISSEELLSAPSLRFSYSNRIVNVPLEGSQASWTGYLIIPSDEIEVVGEFMFSGMDKKGTVGSEVTSGKLFLIDTQPPGQPDTLKLVNENNKIRLMWNYVGEEPEHFNIYRSTTGNTDRTNFKATTKDKAYYDSNVTNKIGYFYRISAVDKAGNEGLLSEEEFLMTEYQNLTSTFKQSPDLLIIINEKIGELESLVQKIDIATAKLEETTDENTIQLSNDYALVANQKEIKGKIQMLIGEMKTYRETAITKEDLLAKIDIINAKLKEYKKDIIREVSTKSKIQKEQLVEKNLVQEAVNNYIRNKALSDELREAYSSSINQLQQEVRITQDIITYEISYEYKESEEVTLIKEKLFSPAELKGVLIQEIIPPEFVKVSEIQFTTTPSDFNSLGAVWDMKDITDSSIRYTIKRESDVNNLQAIKTVLLYDIDEFLSNRSGNTIQASGQLTGAAIDKASSLSSLVQMIAIIVGLVVIAGLLIYYFFFLSPVQRSERDFPAAVSSLKTEPIKVNEADVVSGVGASIYRDDVTSILAIVQESYGALEKGDFELANQHYTLALMHYSRVPLSFKEKLKVNFEMNTLREKIIEAAKNSSVKS